MKFKCGCEALTGKDGVCMSCYNDGLRQCDFHVKPKMGRPVTKTPEERAAKEKEWHKKNPRRKYFREYNQKRAKKKKVMCYIMYEGLYRRDRHGWTDKKILAKVYQSEPRARVAVERIGKGEVVPVKQKENEGKESK